MNEKYIYISNQSDLDNLIKNIKKGQLFAKEFKFTERTLFISLLESLKINYEEFEKKYHYFDKIRHLHISESQFEYIWISTFGLIPKDKSTDNKLVNSYTNQNTVITLLLEKAIEISTSESVYDIDSYNFELLGDLSPALFHNLLFHTEIFCKAYLSLCDIEYPRTHKLSILYSKLKETMYEMQHNDSLFQVLIVDKLEKIVEHVNGISDNFKEQFVKYNDNPDDSTVFIFQTEYLNDMKTTIDYCDDFIIDYSYLDNKTHYLKQGFLQKVLDKAQTEAEKNRIKDSYSHLLSNVQ